MLTALTIFWLALAVVSYVYLGYPLLLRLGMFGRMQSPALGTNRALHNHCDGPCDEIPSLSILVAAHNEESTIAAKIYNLLPLDYPPASVDVLIGDDGSSDDTAAIVRSFAGRGVRLISSGAQQGKSVMQNRLAEEAGGDILVFTDADCIVPPDALRSLVRHFADARIGLVTGRAVFANEKEAGIVANESLYLRYDTWLRAEESSRGILAMASGSFFAMRRSLWRPLDATLGDDFVLPLRILQAGMRNLLDSEIVAVTRLAEDSPRSLLRTKTRIISKDLRALLAYRDLLNPFRHSAIAVALLSHKLLRWLIPYFLVATAASNLLLLSRVPFRIFFVLQIIFYSAAFAGFAWPNRRALRLCSLAMSFCLVNLAALRGTLQCCFGGTCGLWKPNRTARPASAMIATTPPLPGQDS